MSKQKTGSRIKSGMTKIWDWSYTPTGESVILGIILIISLVALHFMAWALWTQGWR